MDKNRFFLKIVLFLLSGFLLCFTAVNGQNQPNYDETKVAAYDLPDPLILLNGENVEDVKTWENKRRPEVLKLFEEEVYGRIPGELNIMTYQVAEESNAALNNKAIRKQIVLKFENGGEEISANLLVYLPKNVEKAPVFIGYNFYGNHTIIKDEQVIITNSWVRNNADFGITNNQATVESRGARTSRWPVEKIIKAGYGLATMYYGDIDPDRNDFSDGIHPLLYTENQTRPGSDEWGSIAAWAWGLTKAMDYFEKDDDIDKSRVILMGHSRLGKTSLWAGALDERFAIVISNNSGCGGAALSRRRFGETVEVINASFPHWFCDNFKIYNDNEDALPVDQHLLIALIAPRPVYIASAEEDKWADPKGEFLAGVHATPVYKLYGKEGIPMRDLPEVNQPVQNTIGYHIRNGKHDVTDYDWDQYIKFANLHLR